MKNLLLLFVFATALISCEFDEDANRNAVEQPSFGSVNLTFNNTIDGERVQLNDATYTNPSNEAYTIEELKYIVSNIVLIGNNGREYAVPEADSYFLINEENPSSKSFTIPNVPSGNYSAVRFGFGVDQSKYPLNGIMNFVPQAEEADMLWSWSAGYRFLKFEGTYTPSGATEAQQFLVHVGSHGDVLDNYKEITISLSENFRVQEDNRSNIAINADMNNMFSGNANYAFSDKDEIMVDPTFAPIIANNMMTVFSNRQ